MLPPLPASTGAEPSSEPSASLFYIPLWMDLSMHALPAVILLFGKSSYISAVLSFSRLSTVCLVLGVLTRVRLHVFGEKVQTPSIDLWRDCPRRIVRNGLLCMGRALRQDQWIVPLSLFDSHGPSRTSHAVHRRYSWRFERVLGFEQDTSVDGMTIALFMIHFIMHGFVAIYLCADVMSIMCPMEEMLRKSCTQHPHKHLLLPSSPDTYLDKCLPHAT